MANNRKLYKEALSVYGSASQVEKTVEECAELIHAIQKSKEGLRTTLKIAAVAEEIADVEIVLAQMRLIFPGVTEMKTKKLERLRERIETIQNEGAVGKILDLSDGVKP